MNQEKKFKITKNYISPTIIHSNSISKTNQKYLKDQNQSKRNSTSEKIANENLNNSKNPLKILQNSSNINVNHSLRFEANYNNNSINYFNSNNLNLNLNFNNNNNNNNSIVKNSNLNYLNINSNYENDSFVYKSGGTNAGIYQKNTDLNFTNKFTDGNNTTLKEVIKVYDVNKKVKNNFYFFYFVLEIHSPTKEKYKS